MCSRSNTDAPTSAGNHDNNIYNNTWAERYHGMKEVSADAVEKKEETKAEKGKGFKGKGKKGGDEADDQDKGEEKKDQDILTELQLNAQDADPDDARSSQRGSRSPDRARPHPGGAGCTKRGIP